MAECLKHKMNVIIDLKTWDSPEETVGLVTGLYKVRQKRSSLQRMAFVCSL